MIYKNKRIAGLNIYKIKGVKSYMLVEDNLLNMPVGTMSAMGPSASQCWMRIHGGLAGVLVLFNRGML